MEEIKVCPFCGGTAKLEHGMQGIEMIGVREGSFVVCDSCGARGEWKMRAFEYASDVEAIKAWNRREDMRKDGAE